jgi:subtilisin family serine protease
MKVLRPVLPLLILAFALFSLAGSAEERAAPVPRPSAEQSAQPAAAGVGDNRYSVLFARFDDAKARQSFEKSLTDYAKDGATVFSSFESYAELFVASHRVAEVRDKVRKAGGWSVRGGQLSVPPPQPARAVGKARGGSEEIFRADDKLKGKGIIIAVVDSGIDFRHPDFIVAGPNSQRQSRLLYYWDTTRQPPKNGPGSTMKVKMAYPNGEPVGTIYTRDELAAELNSTAAQRQIPEGDLNGHGTACAGIAAGNGTANAQFAGLAPLADLIAVRVGREANVFDQSVLLPAICGWIDEVAGNRPVVVSCSFGGQYGSHDGKRVDELELNARFPLDRAGRALCIAAGNDAQDYIHADVQLTGDTKQVELKYRAPKGGSIQLLLNDATPADVKVEGAQATVHMTEVNPLTKTLEMEVRITATANDETRVLTISRTGAKSLDGDAYIVGEGYPEFALGQVARKLVETPGTCGNAITVGSYDWNDQFPLNAKQNVNIRVSTRTAQGFVWDDMVLGQLSHYSNPGPSRLRGTGDPSKPDIVSPGQYFIAPASETINATRDNEPLRTEDRRYRDFNGTSAATPYTAGVIALLFEAKPGLTLRQVKDLLAADATKTADVKKRPEYWGNGKLDRAAVRSMLDSVRSAK